MRITIEIDERALGAPGAVPEVLTTVAPAATSTPAGTAQDGGAAPQAPGSTGTEMAPSELTAEPGATSTGVSAGAAPTIGD